MKIKLIEAKHAQIHHKCFPTLRRHLSLFLPPSSQRTPHPLLLSSYLLFLPLHIFFRPSVSTSFCPCLFFTFPWSFCSLLMLLHDSVGLLVSVSVFGFILVLVYHCSLCFIFRCALSILFKCTVIQLLVGYFL